MKLIPFLLLGLLLSGCGKNLRPDRFPPATLSNYPSAEFYACGERWVGLGYCELQAGDSVSSLEFSIQGLYKGRIRIFSEALPADVIFSYDGSKKIPVDLRGRPTQPIVLGMAISPSFPAGNDKAVEVYGAFAFLLINVVQPEETSNFYKSLQPAGIDQTIRVPVTGASDLGVFSQECGVEQEFIVNADPYPLKLSSLIGIEDQGSCIFYIGTELSQMSVWMSWRYASDFKPLAIPSLEVKGKKLHVEAETGVTLIAKDTAYVVNNKGKFDWSSNKPSVLRLFTVKGRTLVGEYQPGEGWTWKR